MLSSLQLIQSYRQGETLNLAEHPWLEYIVKSEERVVNLERIQSLRQLANSNPVLDYVERTLHTLNSMSLSFWIKDTLEEVLKWSETAKGGTVYQRIAWKEQGIRLFAHNIGSACIYEQHFPNPDEARIQLTKTLIHTHGLVGQYLRGEVPLAENAPLFELVSQGIVSSAELRDLLLPLNRCVIEAVSPDLWTSLEENVKQVIEQITTGAFTEGYNLQDRFLHLREQSIRRGENVPSELLKLEGHPSAMSALRALEDKTLWYVEASLHEFSFEEFIKVFLLTVVSPEAQQLPVRHISFERLMNNMYYDFNNKKKMNIYKKRIIEKALRELTYVEILEGRALDSPHLNFQIAQAEEASDSIYVNFQFSAAAEKLIEFCIEAEKTPLYEKAILMLFDLFELRRDAYDRFHNEEQYLTDMNQSADYKQVILHYVTGSRVIDIGPGGGVMLDLIEDRLPGTEAIGIDISQNVIEALERRKQLEHKKWHVIKGDALDLKQYVEPGSIDTIIFSSILHELYSYIELEGRRFNHNTVKLAMQSAFEVLPIGGRIIIRDGIMSEPADQKRIITFRHDDGMSWLERYAKDFSGRQIQYERLSSHTASLPINDAMEFLYTYTWGPEAYVHEVQEQFGYFTPSHFKAFIAEALGPQAAIIKCDHYLQEGYTEALAPKVLIMDESGEPVPFPDSTCLIVIEKH